MGKETEKLKKKLKELNEKLIDLSERAEDPEILEELEELKEHIEKELFGLDPKNGEVINDDLLDLLVQLDNTTDITKQKDLVRTIAFDMVYDEDGECETTQSISKYLRDNYKELLEEIYTEEILKTENNMKYEKLKSFDLNSIKSQEEADDWKDKVLASDDDDILRYINFLRWQQYNDADIKYMQKIVHFLSYDEIMDIEMENQDILTGDTEDLIINNIVEAEEPITNPINIISPEGVETYSLKAVLDDSFEKVMIASDKDGKLYKFGFIVIQDVKGIEYFAYELYEEPQEYYSQIVDAKVGTRVNVYADIVEENQVLKTYTKIDNFVDELNFILTKKTNQGVLSPIYQGTYSILKKEEVLSSEGISEDRLASQMSKFKNEMAEKLGIKPQDVYDFTDNKKYNADGTVEDFEPIVDDEEDPTSKYTKEYFEDDFTFSKTYYFSIETPEEDDWYNPLTQTILNFHVDNWEYLNDEYVEEVYFMLSEKFGYCEEMEGIWAIDNTKLESVLRTIVRAGGKVKANDENASMFLQRFLRQEKLERILKVSKNFRVVKKIKTLKDVEEFVKDSGTELYHQIGQTLTAILEGTSRLFGEGHIVFDSDHKLVICEIDDELDLVSASNFAIDNSYKRFYVIEKDKYQQYDAWYKESIKTKPDNKE